MANAKKKKPRRKAVMLGVGLDSDGHKRLTTGPNFILAGGSEETHEVMTEKAIKINEKLAAKGKQLEDVSHDEFDEIAHSVGLQRQKPKVKGFLGAPGAWPEAGLMQLGALFPLTLALSPRERERLFRPLGNTH